MHFAVELDRFGRHAYLAATGNLLDDPSIAWSASRRLVRLNTITTKNTIEEHRSRMFSHAPMPD